MKYSGYLGYCISVEGTGINKGIFYDQVQERPAYGDVLTDNHRWDQGEGTLDNQGIRNKISVIMDAFAFNHASDLKYITWLGARWKVTNIEVARPRLILTLGDEYNGPVPN